MKFKESILVTFLVTGAILVIVECGHDDDDDDDHDKDSHHDDDNDGQPDYCPKDNGMFPVPTDCTRFYQCVDGEAILQTCAPGLLFDKKSKMCNFPNQVKCKNQCRSPNGLFPSQHRCDEFVLCTDNKPEVKRCKKGLWFDANLQVCNYKSQVLCNLPGKRKKKNKGKYTTTTKKPKYSDDDDDDDGSYKPSDHEDDGSYKARSKKVRVGQYVSGANLFTVHGAQLKKGHLELAAASVRSVCPKARGLFAYADDCSMFYQCYDGEVLLKNCPAGLLFDEFQHMCAQGRNVDCGQRSVYTPPSPYVDSQEHPSLLYKRNQPDPEAKGFPNQPPLIIKRNQPEPEQKSYQQQPPLIIKRNQPEPEQKSYQQQLPLIHKRNQPELEQKGYRKQPPLIIKRNQPEPEQKSYQQQSPLIHKRNQPEPEQKSYQQQPPLIQKRNQPDLVQKRYQEQPSLVYKINQSSQQEKAKA